MEKTLNLFEVGEHGTVKSGTGEGKIKRRLFDMGITPGRSYEKESAFGRSHRDYHKRLRTHAS